MRKSIITKQKCKKENRVTEHYYYPEEDKTFCAECRRSYRLNRFHNDLVARNNDLKYNSKWRKKNPKKVKKYAAERKLKQEKIRFNFDNAKKDFIVNNISRIQNIHDTYDVRMDTQELMSSIKNINHTTISRIMLDIAKECRRRALIMYHPKTVKQMDKHVINVL